MINTLTTYPSTRSGHGETRSGHGETRSGHATISLEELTEQAALQTRVDRKYVVSGDRVAMLLTGLPREARVLEIAGLQGFRYRSVYFDTATLDSYHSTAWRRRYRFKVRTRTYVDSGLTVLEVKTRGGRGETIKTRLPYTGDGHSLSAVDHERIAEVLQLPSMVPLQGWHPTLTTSYRRTTYFLPASSSRLTVDTDLWWTLPNGDATTTDSAIVETKSAGASSEVDRLLWVHAQRPCSVSKYGTGLAQLRHDLPSNRWHRVQQQYLFPTPSQEI